jgi:hypothetical protein
MSEIVKVPFHGDDILTVDVNGKPHIVLKPAIEAIGLDYFTQLAKLNGRSWAVKGLSPSTGSDGKTYEMVTVDLRTFLMLLATIDEKRVAKDVAPKLIAYQAEVADAVEAYWTKGVAVNPRVGHKEAAEIIAIFARAKVGDAGYWDAKARQLTGRVLGETPEYDQATKPLTVSIYLAGRGVTGKDLKTLAGTFGKRVKAAYFLEHAEEPPTIEDMVGRHMVHVAQYRESHRPLFDRVWQQFYAIAA